MKIRPVVVELFHADGRTDGQTLLVTFRNFLNTPKNVRSFHLTNLKIHFNFSFSSVYFYSPINKTILVFIRYYMLRLSTSAIIR